MNSKSHEFVTQILSSKKTQMETELAAINIPEEGLTPGDKAEFYQILESRHTLQIPKITSRWMKQTAWLGATKTGGFWERKPYSFAGTICLSALHDNAGDYRLLEKLADTQTHRSDMFAACDFSASETDIKIKSVATKTPAEPAKVARTAKKFKKEFVSLHSETIGLLEKWNNEVDKSLKNLLGMTK